LELGVNRFLCSKNYFLKNVIVRGCLWDFLTIAFARIQKIKIASFFQWWQKQILQREETEEKIGRADASDDTFSALIHFLPFKYLL
jgi:hypothetical protein